MISSLIRRFRLWRLRRAGVRLGVNTRVAANVDARADGQGIDLGDGCQLETGVVLHCYGGHIRCGQNVFFGPQVVIYGHGGVDIGEHTLLAMHCCIVAGNHTVPAPDTLIRSQPDVPLPVRIGRDVWLGAGVKVLGGVTIGDGCVVGAGSVVTHDLPACSIAYGVPARVVKTREAK